MWASKPSQRLWVYSPHGGSAGRLRVPMGTKPSPRGQVPGAHHADDVWVDRLNEDPPSAPHTLHQLIERRPLHLLPLQVGHTVQEVKHHPTLGQLPAQQLMQLRGWHIWGGRRGLSLGPSCHSSGQGRALLIPKAGSSAPQTPCFCAISHSLQKANNFCPVLHSCEVKELHLFILT